jgi:hypothetical protein
LRSNIETSETDLPGGLFSWHDSAEPVAGTPGRRRLCLASLGYGACSYSLYIECLVLYLSSVYLSFWFGHFLASRSIRNERSRHKPRLIDPPHSGVDSSLVIPSLLAGR